MHSITLAYWVGRVRDLIIGIAAGLLLGAWLWS